jgi:mannosyl-oligosaccharide alpha-1,3-glucosidase
LPAAQPDKLRFDCLVEECRFGHLLLCPTAEEFCNPCRLYRGGHIVARRERARRSTRAQRRDPFTLVVALDEKGAAKGRLYVDDGSSFAFMSGHYVDADIEFASGTLMYTPKHVGVDYTLTFERVIIYGWPFSAVEANYAAKSQAGAEVEVRRTSVYGGSNARALVVRNPLTPVCKPWTLQIYEK